MLGFYSVFFFFPFKHFFFLHREREPLLQEKGQRSYTRRDNAKGKPARSSLHHKPLRASPPLLAKRHAIPLLASASRGCLAHLKGHLHEREREQGEILLLQARER
jgi:hypothetical protein